MMGEIVESETQQESRSVIKSQHGDSANERPSEEHPDPPKAFIAAVETVHASRYVVTNGHTKQTSQHASQIQLQTSSTLKSKISPSVIRPSKAAASHQRS
jgi:hypothetical protein